MNCIKKWNQADGVALKDIAVIYPWKEVWAKLMASRLGQEKGIDHLLA